VVRLFTALSVLLGLACTRADTVSFRHDVMAVFSKAGCNNGGCHGNAHGRGSLKLSLRGESPDIDFKALIHSNSSRLLIPDAAEESLLLRKPTLQRRHEGGERFKVGSLEYITLQQWIASGLPKDAPDAPKLIELRADPEEHVLIGSDNSVHLKVNAHFSDGSKRDVSRWAVYEPSDLIVDIREDGYVTATQPGETTITVRYLHLQRPVRIAYIRSRPNFAWAAPTPANVIDEAVYAKLRRLRMNPSERINDTHFIRRVTRDLTGLLPTQEEAQSFLADTHPRKRDLLVESLLERPAFADFWALKWSDLLRNEEKALDKKGVKVFHSWIRSAFAENKPLDQFARELVTGIGSSYENPPSNYYRALRNPTLRAEATAQLFLGTRLQCARCHRHPYERWSQDDYYQFAAAFDGIGYKIIENKRKDGLDKNSFNGEQLIQVGLERKLKDPRSSKAPKIAFLPIPGMAKQEGEDLAALGNWLTAKDNPLFARVQVNRIWFQLFGKGIVDPVDDFRSTNPPINPALLDALGEEFVRGGFDLRHLIRFIMRSETYQAAAVPNNTNANDSRNFSHALVQRHNAETLLDSIHQVLGTEAEFTGIDHPLRASQLPGVESVHRNRKPKKDEHFLKVFGRPVRQLNSDLERSNATSLAQVFEMTSGRTLQTLLTDSENRLGKFLDDNESDKELIENLYWTALTRAPRAIEQETMLAHLVAATDRRRALEDISWALINSKEFMLRN